jgi:hypothetical protein
MFLDSRLQRKRTKLYEMLKADFHTMKSVVQLIEAFVTYRALSSAFLSGFRAKRKGKYEYESGYSVSELFGRLNQNVQPRSVVSALTTGRDI